MKMRVSAATIIHDDQKRVLLAQRSASKTWYPNTWETLGGGLEFGESPEACLRREIREELGEQVRLTQVQLFNVYSSVYNVTQAQIHLISVVYLAHIEGIPHINPREIQQLRWCSEQEAMELSYCLNCQQRVIDFFQSR